MSTDGKQPPKITEPGTYDVMIIAPRWEALEAKDGDSNRMQCVLPGHTNDGKMIEARLAFTRTIISGGQNKGKPVWQASAEKLHELGMPKPFNPAYLSKLGSTTCYFVVEIEEYEGKPRAVVKYINTKHREELPADAATAIWSRLTGGAAPTTSLPAGKPIAAAPATAPSVTTPSDDLPW